MDNCKVCEFVGETSNATGIINHKGVNVPVCDDCKAMEEEIQEELDTIVAEMKSKAAA